MKWWSFVTGHPYLLALTLLVLGMLLYEELMAMLLRRWSVSASEAVELINHHSAKVLDLRDGENFKRGHILGAKSVTKQQLHDHIKSGQQFILVLARDVDFWQLKQELSGQTAKSVKILQGGMAAWQEMGLPVAA